MKAHLRRRFNEVCSLRGALSDTLLADNVPCERIERTTQPPWELANAVTVGRMWVTTIIDLGVDLDDVQTFVQFPAQYKLHDWRSDGEVVSLILVERVTS